MRYCVITLVIIQAIIPDLVYGQFTVPKLEFINVQPEWTYIPFDSNFVKNQLDPWSTPFSRKNSWRLDIKNEDIYLFQTSFTQNPYTGHDGYILHKLNLSTGKPEWVLHNNYHSGLKFREYHWSSFFKYENNDELNIIGLKDINPIDTTRSSFFFFANPFKQTINLNSGEITDIKESSSGKHNRIYSAAGFSQYLRLTQLEDRYYTLFSNIYIENDTLKDAVELRKINDPFDIDTLSFEAVVNNTGLPTQMLQLSYRPIFDFINDSTFIMLFTIRNPENEAQSPSKVWLSKATISKEGKLRVIKESNIRDQFYFPQGPALNYQKHLINNQILIYQTMNSTSSPYNSNIFTWLLWYNENLELKLKIDVIRVGDRFYYLPEFISADNEKIILSAYFEDKAMQIKGYDLLEIKATGVINRLGGFHQHISDIKLLLQRAAIANDSSFVVAFRTEVPYNGGITDYSYLMKFRPEILQPTLTSTTDIILEYPIVSISPNPAYDFISLKFNELSRVKVLYISDQAGRRVITQNISSPDIELDISNINSGVYFMYFMNEEGNLISKVHKLVKM